MEFRRDTCCITRSWRATGAHNTQCAASEMHGSSTGCWFGEGAQPKVTSAQVVFELRHLSFSLLFIYAATGNCLRTSFLSGGTVSALASTGVASNVM